MPQNLVSLEVNAIGCRCPNTLIRLKKALDTVEINGIIDIIIDDKSSYLDFNVFCESANHTILDIVEYESLYRYTIRKGKL